MIDAFVDTNVFVYAVDGDEPEKQGRALDLLAGLAGQIAVSAQVLNEYYVTVTRKLARPRGEQDAAEDVNAMSRLPVIAVDRDLVLSALDLHRRHSLSLWDAAIVAAAQRAGCTRLYTEDLNAGQRFGELTVVDPFAD